VSSSATGTPKIAPTASLLPIEQMLPLDASDPTQPTEAMEAMEPTQPALAMDPTHPALATEPTQPADSNGPTDATLRWEPALTIPASGWQVRRATNRVRRRGRRRGDAS